MIIDVFNHLAVAGFEVHEYQYTGFGHIYFVDFILFHRLLGIRNLLSIEHDLGIEKRVQFNRPFLPVRIEMGPAGDALSRLSGDLQHFVWLDYDFELNEDCVEEIRLTSSLISPGSVLLVTTPVGPPPQRSASEHMGFVKQRVGDYFDPGWTTEDFSSLQFSETLARLLERVIAAGIAARPEVEYKPIFGFTYADGKKMLSVGGMIVNKAMAKKLRGADLDELPFVRKPKELSLFDISVPQLTRRERLLLDQGMPSEDGWVPEEFEISARDVASYRGMYRYLPIYGELLF